MGLFSSKVKLIETDFFVGSTDYHSHILPSVDDGFKSVDDTLELLKYYESLSVKRVVLTPHIGVDYRQTIASHDDIFYQLKQQYRGSVELHLAAEYMLDGDMYDLCGSDIHALSLFRDAMSNLKLSERYVNKLFKLCKS